MNQAGALARRVGDLHARLAAEPDLRPSEAVDGLFSELVGLCCSTPASLAAAAISELAEHLPALRRLCAAGETALETHWARRIAAASDPWQALKEFPYLDNYRDLVRLELGMVGAVGDPAPSRVAVLGSGPLPLTALLLNMEYGTQVLHVEREPAALELAAEVSQALGASRGIVGARADVEEPGSAAVLDAAGIAECDVVVLAALVGESPAAKRAVSVRLGALCRPGALVVARSATGMRQLLYPSVHAEDLSDLRVELEAHPHTDVINSVLLARRPGAG